MVDGMVDGGQGFSGSEFDHLPVSQLLAFSPALQMELKALVDSRRSFGNLSLVYRIPNRRGKIKL